MHSSADGAKKWHQTLTADKQDAAVPANSECEGLPDSGLLLLMALQM